MKKKVRKPVPDEYKWAKDRIAHLKHCIKILGLKNETKEIVLGRRSGLSTGIALEYIGQAMQNPEQSFKVADTVNRYEQHKYLLKTVAEIVTKLDLKGFHFKPVTLEFVYSLKPEPYTFQEQPRSRK